MKRTTILALSLCLAAGAVSAQNLLSNGNFNAGSAGWTTWPFGGGWANFDSPAKLNPSSGNYWAAGVGVYDGSTQFSAGAASTSGGGGAYQVVSATAGTTYQLNAAAGVENWWLPTGEIRLFFLDAGNNQLSSTTIETTDAIHGPDLYDTGVPYQNWSLMATAPAGTTQAKVEFAGYGGGSCWFDNASLTVVPEPTTASLLLLGAALLLGRTRRG